MNSINDMIKHKTTEILNRGTINGALIWAQIISSCMEMSSLAPWNVSGRIVDDESRSISRLFSLLLLLLIRKTKPKSYEKVMGKLAKKWKSIRWFTLRKEHEYVFCLFAVSVIICFLVKKNNGGRAGMSVTSSNPPTLLCRQN